VKRNRFAIYSKPFHTLHVTQPLALVLYEDLMPGSQLVNRLQDLNYRVQPVSDPNQLCDLARSDGPMVVFADLTSSRTDICGLIAKLKQDPATAHIPVVAFADEVPDELHSAGRQAGATLVVTDSAILSHLPQLLEQALHVE
jgi:CheY-like chemotaxis protein